MLSVDILSSTHRFDIPMFFIQGALDDVTPTSLVREFVDRIQAPRKALTVIPDGGHLAVMALPDRFLHELRRLLAPTKNCDLAK